MSDQEDLVPLPPLPLGDERVLITPVLFATYPTFLLAHPVILRLTRKKGVDGVVFRVICADTNQLYFEFIQKFGQGTLQFLVDYTGKPVLKVERTDAFTSTVIGGNERVIGQVRCYSADVPFLKKYVVNYTDYNLGSQVLTAEYQQDSQSIEFRLDDEISESPWLAKMYKPKMFADFQMEIRPGVDIAFMAALGCLRALTIRRTASLTPQETHLCALSFQHVSNAPIIYNISRKIMQACGSTVIFTPHGDENQAPSFITESGNMSEQTISIVPPEGVQTPIAFIRGRLSMATAFWCVYTKFELDGATDSVEFQSFDAPRKVTLSLTKLTACWRDGGETNRRIKIVRDISLDLSVEFRLTGVDDEVAVAQLSKALPKEKGWRQDRDHWGQLQVTSGVDLCLMVAMSSVLVTKWFKR